MSRHTMVRQAVLLFAAVAAVLPAARPAQAQTTVLEGFSLYTHAGIGFVVDAPDQLTGAGAFLFGPRLYGWGIYVDAKRSRETPRDEAGFVTNITVDEAEGVFSDRLVTTKSYWTGVNGAVVRVVSSGLAVYAGAGYAKQTAYRRYYDESGERGEFGTYWIEDPAESGTRVNVLGGAFFRASRRLVFQLGLESAPRGASVGVYLAQPFAW